MGLLLYGGLGLLPIWVMVGYALLAQPGVPAQPSPVVLWLSVGAVPACFMTLAFAEAIMVGRERRLAPRRQQAIVLIALPLLVLLYAAGTTWESQQAQRRQEHARMAQLVGRDAAVIAWLGHDVQARVASFDPDPLDLLGEPVRFWLRAEAGRRHAIAVVSVDRGVTPPALRVVCVEKGEGQGTPHTRGTCR